MSGNNHPQKRDPVTTEDPLPPYESAVRYARNNAAASVAAATLGNSDVAAAGNAAVSDRGVAVSLNELARKHRQAARRDRRRCQGQPGATDNEKPVTMETDMSDARVTGPAGGFQEPPGEPGRIPRSPSQERVFVLTGSVTDSSYTDRITANAPSQNKHGEKLPFSGVYNNGAFEHPQELNTSHPHHKNRRKKLRWKEPGSGEGESCELDDVFSEVCDTGGVDTVSEVFATGGVDSSDYVSGTNEADNLYDTLVSAISGASQSGIGGVHKGWSAPNIRGVDSSSKNSGIRGVDADKNSSAAQTNGRVTAAVGSRVADVKSCDLTTSTVTCDPLSDNTVSQAQNYTTKTGEKHVHNSAVMEAPRRAISDFSRKVPKLERQEAFSTATYSSSSSDESDEGRDASVYNVDLIVKGQGHPKVSEGQKVRDDEDVYVPLWAAGNKVSTTVQYKSDDTYVPIWTTNMPKTSRDLRTSRSMDDMLLEGSDLQGQGQNKGERSPGAPKTMSLDVGANKTTNVIPKDRIPQRTNRMANQGQNGGQIRPEGQSQISASCDNNRNYNGRLSKLKLVYGAPDLPQVHNSAKVKDTDPRSLEGHMLKSRSYEGQTVALQLPSLLERRGILLKEASSEDRPPPLPVKYGRNLRSYEQLGRSLERSRSMSRSKTGSTRLHSGATWDQHRSMDPPPSGQKLTPRDQDQSQSAGPLQKLKRHLSRNKSYSLDHGDPSSLPPPSEVAPVRHKNHFDLAIFTCCCCVSPLGLVAVILSVLSDMWWREGEVERAHSYSRAALILCVLGIVSTVGLWSALLATNALPFIKHVETGEGGHQFSS